MAKKRTVEAVVTCASCVHEFACQMWHRGSIHNADARHCTNYETVKGSPAYLCGYLDGKKEALHGAAYRCPVCDGTGVVYGPEFERLEAQKDETY